MNRRRALRLDPLDEEVGAELGATLSELGRDAEALTVYEGFAERQSFTLSCMNHGNTLLHRERLKEAAAAYERCLAILPTWTDPRVNLASVLMAIGQLDKADAQLGKLAHDGVDPSVQLALTEQLAQHRAARAPARR